MNGHHQSSAPVTSVSGGGLRGGVGGVGGDVANYFDPTNPNVPRNCTITRPPPITKPGRCDLNQTISIKNILVFDIFVLLLLLREPVVLRAPLDSESCEPLTPADNELLTRHREYRYQPEKMTWDPHCYECKVRYRDPKPKDLVMYLHAWRYKV